MFNYPWLDRIASPIPFGGSPADTRQILTLLNQWTNRQYHLSKMVMGPDRVMSSPRLLDWLSQTPMVISGTQQVRTIWEVFNANNNKIRETVWASEFENVFPGVDAMLFYRTGESPTGEGSGLAAWFAASRTSLPAVVCSPSRCIARTLSVGKSST